MFIFGAAGAAAVGQADISDVVLAGAAALPRCGAWPEYLDLAITLYASRMPGFRQYYPSFQPYAVGGEEQDYRTVCAAVAYNNFVGWRAFLSSAIHRLAE